MKRFMMKVTTNGNMNTYFCFVKIMGVPTVMFECNKLYAAVYYEYDLDMIEMELLKNMSRYNIKRYKIEWL